MPHIHNLENPEGDDVSANPEKPITGDEFRQMRERLKLSQRQLARVFQMSESNGERTVRRWEQDEFPVPGHAQIAIRALCDENVQHFLELAG
jgi:DNA-binding transcriptional regulator YiaG